MDLKKQNETLEQEIKVLKQEKKELFEENKLLLPYKKNHEKRSKTKEVIYFDEPLTVGKEEYTELTFRRPKGRDVAAIMTIENPSERIHHLARLLCPELNVMHDEDFYELDYKNHYKYIGDAVEGFM